MIGINKKWQEMTRKRKKGKGREIPTTEMSATTKKKKYPVLYSFHCICSTVHTCTAVLDFQIRIWDLDFVLVNRQKEP